LINTYSVLDGQERLEVKNQLNSSFPIIQAVIVGVQQGQIFRNTSTNYWVLHKAGFSEVFLNDDDGTELIDFIIENKNLPTYFHIYNPPEKLVDVFQARLEIFNVRERNRVQLRYKEQQMKIDSPHLLDGQFTLSQVSDDNFDLLAIFNLGLSYKFWNGKEDFVRNSLGVFIKDKHNNPVSLCYAASVADHVAEIDVLTTENYRGKGFAKLVVSFFISNCSEKSIIPNWDCFKENQNSLKTALAAGFFKNLEYRFLSIFKSN